MVPLLIKCQRGLGDNIYARPFIRAATARHEVWLDTPWPELFEDLPVQFAKPHTMLRTQRKNVLRNPGRWASPPAAATVTLNYGAGSLRAHGSITNALRRILPLRGQPYIFDLPDMGSSPIGHPGKPIALVRPVTERAEWLNTARNPLPEYVYAAADVLMHTHHVVLVADFQDNAEWLVGELPPHHTAYVRGELTVKEMLALLRVAHVAIGGVGWIVPAAIALQAPAFIILGGMGAHNAPDVITDPEMDLSNIHFASPKEYCQCATMSHECKKEIPNLLDQWNHFATSRGLPRMSWSGFLRAI